MNTIHYTHNSLHLSVMTCVHKFNTIYTLFPIDYVNYIKNVLKSETVGKKVTKLIKI